MSVSDEAEARLVGSDRVLAVLIELADHPNGVTLDELAQRLHSPKSTIHRALMSLRRAKLAGQLSRGVYVTGDEFYRLAFHSYSQQPDAERVRPVLEALSERFGETTHYAVLDGTEVVYRAKTDPLLGAVRLTSVVGGRNPAYRTAVGKMLLALTVEDQKSLERLVGTGKLERRTPHTISSVSQLWDDLQRTRDRGYAVDDQENEMGINCVAVPVLTHVAGRPRGAISVSALSFRLPLAELEASVGEILTTVASLDPVR